MAAAELVVPVVDKGGAMADLFRELGCRERFEIPTESAGPAAIFSAAGLLAGSVMGLDVVRLLEGAVAMNERFRTAPLGANPPLDFAAIRRLMRQTFGADRQRIVAWQSGAAAVARWCARLWESLDFESEISNSRFRILNFESRIRELRVDLIVESVRRDRIVVERSDSPGDPLDQAAGQAIPELLAAAIQAAKAADTAAGRPTVEIVLPALDESGLGQLFQMMILASAIENEQFRAGNRELGK